MKAKMRISEKALCFMRAEIVEADGAEVFFVGAANEDGFVEGVAVAARGNDAEVLAVNYEDADVLIHNHPSGVLKPSEADLEVASKANQNSMGFFIIDNAATEVYVVLEVPKKKKIVPIEENEAVRYLSKDGSFAKKQKNFEERPTQLELMRNIVHSFNENKIGIFEAGTGVGKSFAYLIPSMMWAIQNDERVVISTGTINLQQQLIEKDVPQASLILGKNVKSVLLKGRQNYVCLRRLNDAIDDRDFFDDDIEIVEMIYKWSKKTSSGDRADLIENISDTIWTRVNSESDACMGMKCPFHDECFVTKVRKEAADAQILIVNNHLFFADIASRMEGIGFDEAAVLPPYHRVVFDEAHGIEESATSFFSSRFNRFSILKQINLLFREGRRSASGFLFTVMAVSEAENAEDAVALGVEKLKTAVNELDEVALECLGDETTLRVNEKTARSLAPVFDKMDNLCKELLTFISLVKNILEGVKDEDSELQSVWETKNVVNRLGSFVEIIKGFLAYQEDEESVFHFQKVLSTSTGPEGNSFFVVFSKTPLNIAPIMSEHVFEPLSSVVCVSATLKINGTFGYWTHRTGVDMLESERVLYGDFASPFSYATRVLFSVPSDAPFPDDTAAFQNYTEQTILDLCLAAKGRTLVLFTSYESLRRASQKVSDSLAEHGITLLKQGDDDRFRLLEHFKADSFSTLFATDSFWEGVDVPGESLSQVIIVKLPFSVPNDPVFAARSELIEKNGGSSFMDLSIPTAVIKFRQGFGRLMRRGDDCGCIAVLDRRIVEKRYGSIFTKSVPKTFRLYCSAKEISETTERFLSALTTSTEKS